MKFLILIHLGEALTVNANQIKKITSYNCGDPALGEQLSYNLSIEMVGDGDLDILVYKYRTRQPRDKFHRDILSAISLQERVVKV